MNRREALSEIGRIALGAAALASFPDAARGEPVKPKCRPTISGALWWLDPAETVRWGESGWRRELEEQRRIGFDLLWLLNTQAAMDHPGDPLGIVMDLCARRGVQVILDTGTAPGRWYDDFRPEREIEACGKHIARLAERFRSHPAFYAWYIPHEIYMWWDENARKIERLYAGLTDLCRKGADLPVTLSPFFILDRTKVFGDFRFNEPDEYRAFWARLIRKSEIDIIMLQDSGEHFSYVTNEQRRPFFEALSAACKDSGARFWGNVETAEYVCPSIEEYVRLYGRVHHSAAKGLPWRPVPIGRMKEKLDLASRYSERIVSWGYREFCRPALGDDAKKWYDDYRAYAAEVRR